MTHHPSSHPHLQHHHRQVWSQALGVNHGRGGLGRLDLRHLLGHRLCQTSCQDDPEHTCEGAACHLVVFVFQRMKALKDAFVIVTFYRQRGYQYM